MGLRTVSRAFIAVSAASVCGQMCMEAFAAESAAQNPATEQITSADSLSVKSGPLEAQRRALLKDIYEGKARGIGIKNYLLEFQALETMVEMGEPTQNIQRRIDLMWDSLDEQIKSIRVSKAAGRGLTPEQARQYMVSIVNADRAKYRLPPVTLDSVASLSGTKHCQELAAKKYLSHWNTRGQKPDQRYTENGGSDNVSENAAYRYGNLKLLKSGLISAADLEEIEWALISEKPPKDGHRLNILRPEHNKVGIGLGFVTSAANEGVLVVSQEFVDCYGDYAKLPTEIFRKKKFEVAGTLFPGVKLECISINYEAEPKPMSVEELKKTYSYRKADESVFETCVDDYQSIFLKKQGNREQFSCQITPGADWKAGLYYVMIYAVLKDGEERVLISTRTVHLK